MEGKEILSKLGSGEQLILLDERGSLLSSVEFSNFVQQRFNAGGKALVFVIGGAYGFSP